MFADDKPYVQLYTSSNDSDLMSGISNGVEVILDLEIYDSADIGEVGDGLGFIIDNKDNYPLINLNGFSIEPGKLAMIKIQPTIYSISHSAVDRFDYKDRKCVDKKEIDLGYFETYSLPNCLVAATYTEILENCPGVVLDGNFSNSGIVLACSKEHMSQAGRWKIERTSQKQCFPSCQR